MSLQWETELKFAKFSSTQTISPDSVSTSVKPFKGEAKYMLPVTPVKVIAQPCKPFILGHMQCPISMSHLVTFDKSNFAKDLWLFTSTVFVIKIVIILQTSWQWCQMYVALVLLVRSLTQLYLNHPFLLATTFIKVTEDILFHPYFMCKWTWPHSLKDRQALIANEPNPILWRTDRTSISIWSF